MSGRRRLPQRRANESFELVCNGLHYTATIARFDDGSLGEIFLRNHEVGSADINARDAAVVASLALQHGVELNTIRHALIRDAKGAAASPLAMALDLIADAAHKTREE
jgi:ribonucleoside-diphosphate reductase alpha chain